MFDHTTLIELKLNSRPSAECLLRAKQNRRQGVVSWRFPNHIVPRRPGWNSPPRVGWEKYLCL